MPTGLSLATYFSDNCSERELVMNILNAAEEESSEQKKAEKEKEKQLNVPEFLSTLLNINKFSHFDYLLKSKLLKGSFDFPTPPPKVS